MLYGYLAGAVAALALLVYLGPLFWPRKRTLPVLLLGKTGTPYAAAKDKTQWVSVRKLKRLLHKLRQHHFTPVWPADILAGTLPERPVLLVWAGGYQSFYTQVFPLLQEYQYRAVLALPAGLIGQYDAWDEAPWQPLITAEQLAELQQSGLVAFASQGLDGTWDPLDEDSAVWQIQEAHTRLQRLYHVQPHVLLLPNTPLPPAAQAATQELYPLVCSRLHGNNILPLSGGALRTFALRRRTDFIRLFWRLTRP